MPHAVVLINPDAQSCENRNSKDNVNRSLKSWPYSTPNFLRDFWIYNGKGECKWVPRMLETQGNIFIADGSQFVCTNVLFKVRSPGTRLPILLPVSRNTIKEILGWNTKTTHPCSQIKKKPRGSMAQKTLPFPGTSSLQLHCQPPYLKNSWIKRIITDTCLDKPSWSFKLLQQNQKGAPDLQPPPVTSLFIHPLYLQWQIMNEEGTKKCSQKDLIPGLTTSLPLFASKSQDQAHSLYVNHKTLRTSYYYSSSSNFNLCMTKRQEENSTWFYLLFSETTTILLGLLCCFNTTAYTASISCFPHYMDFSLTYCYILLVLCMGVGAAMPLHTCGS